MDFQFDADELRRMVKIASIIDRHTGEGLGGIVAPSITGGDLTRREIGLMAGIPQAVEFGEHYYHQHTVPAPLNLGQTRALI